MNKRWLYYLPLLIFLGMAIFLFRGLSNNPSDLPSALIGKPFPAFQLSTTNDPHTSLTESALLGKVTLINVWATWCASCAVEHGQLLKIAQQDKQIIVGINYKDDREAAQRWLKEKGDPFTVSVFDADGKLGMDLGVYGAPETYIVDAQGIIRYKWVGIIDEAVWHQNLKPVIEQWSKK